MIEFEPFPDEDAEAQGQKRSATIQSITIAMRFLNVLALAGQALPLVDLARQTRTGRSTAHRYMQSLVKEGLASQDPVSGHYDLGAGALSIGIAALRRVDAVEMAGVQMKQLAANHAMSGGVAIWTDRGPTLVRWYRSAYFSITPLGLGDTLPVDNTACGLVFQAFLPRATIEAARRVQPAHFVGTLPGKPVIDRVRREGWAELTSHLLSNVTGQAAPILDAQGELTCVVTTVTDLGKLNRPEDRLALQDVARLINRATGGQVCFD
ncbi:IclR family transcriptional regulator [Paenirhodobacter populi]|uniref:IclR family transcriptional regulator n=1 Tax=Paenirhodobacter populi TaxID=2306993 RepID=A0A443JLW2_9RHOB|nr:IclR family transcriptional regulator [Sinirhodobacter populi]RWR05723.1 IclR family transcriptional regulator [Sinirhodobacter populi]RWR15330.1 IclR family transcriptional regulator [Sinirhodobacter populi]RWR21488.1 IclR family transcriptional regulator [Sinirhodobacter populi]